MVEVVSDITDEDIAKWTDSFYKETALQIIQVSPDLRADWKTKIEPQFKTFFMNRDEVKERLGMVAFGDEEGANEQRIESVEVLYGQAKKILHAKVKAHFGFAENRLLQVLEFIGHPFDSIGALIDRFRSNSDKSTHEGKDFLDSTDASMLMADTIERVDQSSELIFPSPILGITLTEYETWKAQFKQAQKTRSDLTPSVWFSDVILPTFGSEDLDEQGSQELSLILNSLSN